MPLVLLCTLSLALVNARAGLSNQSNHRLLLSLFVFDTNVTTIVALAEVLEYIKVLIIELQ